MTTNKPKIITTTLRLPEDLHQQLAKAAEENERPLNTFIVRALRKLIAKGEWLDGDIDDGK